MAASLQGLFCPLCNTLGETTMILSREKGLLKVRLEEDDMVETLKQQMAKCYGNKNASSGNFDCWDNSKVTQDWKWFQYSRLPKYFEVNILWVQAQFFKILQVDRQFSNFLGCHSLEYMKNLNYQKVSSWEIVFERQ